MAKQAAAAIKWPAAKTEMWPLTAIIPYEKNARTHPPEQIALLATLMARRGVDQPIVVDEAGVILKGHGRRMAALHDNFAEALAQAGGRFPVAVHRGLSEAAKRAMRIEDNQLSLLSGWDNELLRLELGELKAEGYDLPEIGFDVKELDRILSWGDPLGAMPVLRDGDRTPFQQLTFTLHDSQVATVGEAIKAAKAAGPFEDAPNENSNGNALARICEAYLARGGQ